jgi:pimeloyl-ACP methyl ester carboxylesterase
VTRSHPGVASVIHRVQWAHREEGISADSTHSSRGISEDGPVTSRTHTGGRRWRRRRIVIGFILAAAALAYASVSAIAATILTAGTHDTAKIPAAAIGPVHEDVSFMSRDDGLRLRGWLFHASIPTGRSVIFVHGWQANRVDTGFGTDAIARDMIQHGYDALLFDLRSCGESDGDRFTLGTSEPRDLLGAYDFMRSQGYDPARMVVVGDSMGAATVIEASPQLRDVGALVADSAFSELRPLIEKELPRRSHLPSAFSWGVITAARTLYGIEPDLRPVDVVASLPERAFLFFHTTGDDFIPSTDAIALYRASSNAQTRLDLVPGQGHVQTYKSDPARYLATLYGFADQQMAERALMRGPASGPLHGRLAA